jgi:hypothetical protein
MPILILNLFFSKFFDFVMHEHVSYYFKSNIFQHGFTKSKSTVTNLVTYLVLAYFSNMKVGVSNHQSVCVYVSVGPPLITFEPLGRFLFL